MTRILVLTTLILTMLAATLHAADNLLPMDKLKPFEATFDGEKIVAGRGPSFPWFATKWQKDAAGFVSYGPLPDNGGDGITIWSDAKYGPNFWIDPQPIGAGTYRLTFDARSIGDAPWRLVHKVVDLPDPTLAKVDPVAEATEMVEGKGGMRTFKFAASTEWRTITLNWTVKAEKARHNFDFGLLAPGGKASPLMIRNIRVEQIGQLGAAEVEQASASALEQRRLRQLSDFYGSVSGSVVAATPEQITLRIDRLYPYTQLDRPESMTGRQITIDVTPATFAGNDREIRNQLATTPPRALAMAYFASVKPGQSIELGIYGDLSSDRAKLSRLPGPTTLAPGAKLPDYLGAKIDEASVTTTLYVSAKQGNDANSGASPTQAVASIERAFVLASPLLDRGTGVRIRIAPGVYRPASTLRLTDYDDKNQSRLAPLSAAAREATLIIEGETPDTVFIRGSVTSGYEPATWTLVDADKRVYRHDWTHDFGTRNEGYYKPAVTDVRLHRRELLALNGKLMNQVLLEDYAWVDPSGTRFEAEIGLITSTGGKVEGKTGYVYRGFRDPVATLQPGEFGVAEKDPGQADHAHPNSIFLRLPDGAQTLDGAAIEVGMLQTLLRVQDKSNLVLRNLTFEHSTGWYNAYYEKSAIDTNPWGSFAPSRNWLWENVVARNNRGHGAAIWWVRNATLRNCQFVDNGHLGIRPSFVNEFVMEDCRVDRNNRVGQQASTCIHGVGGLDFTGQNTVFRRVTFNDNFGRGFRSDYGLEDVLFEDCEVARNIGQGGVFHEIEFGPAVWRNSRIIDNTGQQGFGLLAVNRVTLDTCTIANNQGGQIQFYISPKRYRMAEMLPLGWMRTNDPRKGYDHVGIAEDAFLPRGYIRDFTLRNCVVAASGDNHLIARFAGVGDAKAYGKFIRSSDFTADANTYWNPDRPNAFENFEDAFPYNQRTFVDFATWQRLTGDDTRSAWRSPR